MTEIRAWLATQGRTRFIAGDEPPDDVRARLWDLVREHRLATGRPLWIGDPITARHVNAALDWKEAQDG